MLNLNKHYLIIIDGNVGCQSPAIAGLIASGFAFNTEETQGSGSFFDDKGVKRRQIQDDRSVVINAWDALKPEGTEISAKSLKWAGEESVRVCERAMKQRIRCVVLVGSFAGSTIRREISRISETNGYEMILLGSLDARKPVLKTRCSWEPYQERIAEVTLHENGFRPAPLRWTSKGPATVHKPGKGIRVPGVAADVQDQPESQSEPTKANSPSAHTIFITDMPPNPITARKQTRRILGWSAREFKTCWTALRTGKQKRFPVIVTEEEREEAERAGFVFSD